MRSYIVAGAAFAASVAADCVQDPPTMNNFYCSLVEKISYTGFGTAGQYQKITNMANGACDKEPYSYSGPLSPLDEGLSWHWRGPLNIYQFAAYLPQSSSSKVKRTEHERRHPHGHQQFHKRAEEIRQEKRAVGDLVTATIDGQVVHWINTYDGGAPAGDAAVSVPAVSSATPTVGAGYVAPPKIAAVAETPSPKAGYKAGHKAGHKASPSTSDDAPVAAGDWKRVAYYSGGGGVSEGLVTLNNFGGQGSGVFDNTYGLSLSYASSDGASGTSKAQQFGGNLTSNQEIVFFTDSPCTTSTCDYWRPGTVAYQGWAGATKAFFFEFDMPYDGQTGFNGDMPSLWALNAAIPRTAQYNGCSCWATGCGEFDVCEVLNSGNSKCKSTFHGNTPGGSSDYFDRPTKPTKFSVVFANNQVHVQQLDDSFEFSNGISESQINSLTADKSQSNDLIASLFSLVS